MLIAPPTRQASVTTLSASGLSHAAVGAAAANEPISGRAADVSMALTAAARVSSGSDALASKAMAAPAPAAMRSVTIVATIATTRRR